MLSLVTTIATLTPDTDSEAVMVGYAFHRMFATTAPGLSVVIGLPVAFVLLSAGVFVGLFILWSRARS